MYCIWYWYCIYIELLHTPFTIRTWTSSFWDDKQWGHIEFTVSLMANSVDESIRMKDLNDAFNYGVVVLKPNATIHAGRIGIHQSSPLDRNPHPFWYHSSVCVCVLSLYIYIYFSMLERCNIYYIFLLYIHTPLLFCLIWTYSCASFSGFADARYWWWP